MPIIRVRNRPKVNPIVAPKANLSLVYLDAWRLMGSPRK